MSRPSRIDFDSAGDYLVAVLAWLERKWPGAAGQGRRVAKWKRIESTIAVPLDDDLAYGVARYERDHPEQSHSDAIVAVSLRLGYLTPEDLETDNEGEDAMTKTASEHQAEALLNDTASNDAIDEARAEFDELFKGNDEWSEADLKRARELRSIMRGEDPAANEPRPRKRVAGEKDDESRIVKGKPKTASEAQARDLLGR